MDSFQIQLKYIIFYWSQLHVQTFRGYVKSYKPVKKIMLAHRIYFWEVNLLKTIDLQSQSPYLV
jgi:hypothetical protein